MEQYLEEIGPGAEVSSSLIDYKIWCFDGRPYCVFVTFNRQPDSVAIGCYDTDWNPIEDSCVFSGHFRKGPVLPRPESLDKMLEYASVLSAGFSQVRVDLYNTDGQIRFGEMTFTSNGGFMTYFSSDSLKKMGDLCHAGALPGQTSVK